MEDMPELVSSSPLECLQLHCTTIIEKLEETQLDGLVATLISTHGPRLKHLSMHRLPISLKVLHDVCTGFKNLEHLFVVVEPTDLVSACPRIWFVVLQSVSGAHRKFAIESHTATSDPHQFRGQARRCNSFFVCVSRGRITNREAMQPHGHTNRMWWPGLAGGFDVKYPFFGES